MMKRLALLLLGGSLLACASNAVDPTPGPPESSEPRFVLTSLLGEWDYRVYEYYPPFFCYLRSGELVCDADGGLVQESSIVAIAAPIDSTFWAWPSGFTRIGASAQVEVQEYKSPFAATIVYHNNGRYRGVWRVTDTLIGNRLYDSVSVASTCFANTPTTFRDCAPYGVRVRDLRRRTP